MTTPAVARPIPSAGETIGVIASLTFKRLVRGRLVWFVGLAAGLPSLIGLALRSTNDPIAVMRGTLNTVLVLFAILAPVLTGSAVAEELGSKTATYLWSRPFQRWTILVGKLVVLAPVTAAILTGSWLVAVVLGGGLFTAQAIAAVFVGALAVSLVSASIATIGPRHGIAFPLVYLLLVDAVIGAVPASIRQLSMFHQTAVLTGLPPDSGDAPGSPLEAALWIAAMSTIWLVVALRALRTREA